jgi:hypothetical protein
MMLVTNHLHPSGVRQLPSRSETHLKISTHGTYEDHVRLAVLGK